MQSLNGWWMKLTCTCKNWGTIFLNKLICIRELDLEPLQLPRGRRPPARFTGPANPHNASSPEEHFRTKYFSVVDNAVQQLSQRFDKASSSLKTYVLLDSMFLKGKVIPDIIKMYPELNLHSISVQLPMFKSQFEYVSVEEGRQHMQAVSPEVRLMFNQVERVLRLLLVMPASSCSAERSFSALRRLKTWLRNSMTQNRLNAVAVCHVHQHHLDDLDLQKIAAEFVSRSEIRRRIFGKFE